MNVKLIIFCVIGAIVAFFVFKNLAKIKKFVNEVVVELKKVSWSTKKELIDATWIIMLSSAFLGIFIATVDFVLSKMLGLIIG